MSQAKLPWLNLAQQLLAHEAGGGRSAAELADAADKVCKRLRDHLAVLIGEEGVRILIARALRLANEEAPFLEGVEAEVQSHTCLKGLHERVERRDPAEVGRALALVFGNFTWLLGTFIGHDLAMQLLRRAWPEVTLGEQVSSSEEVEE